MKKYILFFLVIGSIVSVKSQKISVEPNIGMNIMTMPLKEVGLDHKIALNGGLNGNYEIFDNFKISIGLGISDRRFKYASSDTISLLESFRTALEFAGIDVDEIDSTLEANNVSLRQYDKIQGTSNIMFFEIPISASYQWKSFVFKAGGYFGFRMNYGKKQQLISRVPVLETIDISAFDETGLLSFFLPKPYSETYEDITNDENLDQFNFGIRLGIGYKYDSHLSFNGSFNMDLNNYEVNNNNELTNQKYFFRLGMAYEINSLSINKNKITKPRFD